MNRAVLLHRSRVGRQRIEHLRDVPGAIVGRPVRRARKRPRARRSTTPGAAHCGARRREGRRRAYRATAMLVPVRALSYSGVARSARSGTDGSRAASCRRSCRCRDRRSSPRSRRRPALRRCPGRSSTRYRPSPAAPG